MWCSAPADCNPGMPLFVFLCAWPEWLIRVKQWRSNKWINAAGVAVKFACGIYRALGNKKTPIRRHCQASMVLIPSGASAKWEVCFDYVNRAQRGIIVKSAKTLDDRCPGTSECYHWHGGHQDQCYISALGYSTLKLSSEVV